MRKILAVSLLSALALLAAACGSGPGGASTGGTVSTGKVIKSAPVGNNLTAELANEVGALKHGEAEFYLTFKDASGKPVEVGAVALNFYMPGMGAMPVMNDPTTFTTTSTPGVYHGKAKIEMAGEWQAQISYEGPKGTGKTSFPVSAQ
jgi:YtkA-like